jgi:hypothetical protein
MNARIVTVAMIALLGASLTACGEKPQTALYEDGKYRGKPDGRPWDSPPSAYGSGTWNKGDHATWENQLRTRNTTQNENKRIGY